MKIIRIGSLEVQNVATDAPIPDGWGIIPDTLELEYDDSGIAMLAIPDPPYLRSLPEAEIFTALKEQKHEQRRQARTAAELSPFTYNGHPMDSDRDSIMRIGNAATAALIATANGQPFDVEWACNDEYVMPLDAAGVLGLQLALAAHGAAAHAASQAQKALIDAANTKTELEAIEL